MTSPTFRPYTSADRESCLVIFDQNVPQYFGEEERADYEGFLDELPGQYFVLEHDGAVVGCGGYIGLIEEDNIAILSWGMIAPDYQKKGYGQLLLDRRLELVKCIPEITSIILNTSQHTAPFFEQYGFKTEEIIKDGCAKGLDDYEMVLTL